MSKLKQVSPEDFDVELLKAAAREGRLYVDEEKREVSKEEVIKEVRAYVARISPLVTCRYSSLVDELWEEIFQSDVLMDVIMPKHKARKCKEFDKYGVRRIIGVLRENGVYEQRSDPQYDALLEGSCKDSPYRRYLGQGLERHQKKALRNIVEAFANFNKLVK
jgi:hypothetical protein